MALQEPDWLIAARRRPRLRGVIHQYAFFAAVVLGVALVVGADGSRARTGSAVFAACVAAMLGISALYHRVVWPPTRRRWMRRLDHAAIFLLIAGTYTPFALIALDGAWRATILAVVWSGAGLAIVLKVAWVDGPRWLAAVVGVALGWIGVVVLPQLHEHAGTTGVALLAVGGILYTVGAIVYARKRPDPLPNVFGYHELFHSLVVAAAACQYAAVAFVVL